MKKMKLIVAFLLLCSVLIPANKLFAINGKLLAGTAKVNMTPLDQGVIHDSLYVRSLVLEASGERIAFVSIDLGGYTNDKLIANCKKKFKIDQLFFCPSHTHSGASSKKDPSFFEERIVRSLDLAVKNMFQARISAGMRSFPQLGFNRLIVRDDGHAREPWFYDDHYLAINFERIPFGPVDPEVGIIKLEDLNGKPRAFIMNYACHSDAVWGNFALSADYPGVATRMVEEAFNKEANCLFIQGGAGNIAPLFKTPGRKGPDDPVQTDYTLIDRMGKLLSIEAVKLAKSIRPEVDDEADIKVMTDSLKFTGRFDKTARFNINFSTILINKRITIATFPGEPFIKFQLDWKKDIASGTAFFFGYTWQQGTWPVYVPDIKSSALGGYGADMGPVLMEIGAGETIMNTQLKNYYRLTGMMRSEPGPTNSR
jgi:neutral ceramidase